MSYAAVGAVATAAHYAILVGLVEAGLLAPQRAAALGAWVGAQVAFAGNAAFTFRGAGATLGAWWRFQLTAARSARCSASRLVAAGVRLGLHYLLAQIVATLIGLVVTFEINRRWSFAVAHAGPIVMPAAARSAANASLPRYAASLRRAAAIGSALAARASRTGGRTAGRLRRGAAREPASHASAR